MEKKNIKLRKHEIYEFVQTTAFNEKEIKMI